MTIQTQAVLGALLAADGEVYGLQLIRACGLAGGTVYPIMQRLLAVGWVVAHWEPPEQASAEGRPPRRYYALSPEGSAQAHNALHNPRRRTALSQLRTLVDPDGAFPAEQPWPVPTSPPRSAAPALPRGLDAPMVRQATASADSSGR